MHATSSISYVYILYIKHGVRLSYHLELNYINCVSSHLIDPLQELCTLTGVSRRCLDIIATLDL